MSDNRRVRVLRWDEGSEPLESSDELAAEEPLEIRVGGIAVSVTMRTPGNDAELVAGFLLSEGLLQQDEVPLVRHEAPNTVNVALSGSLQFRTESIRRGTITASSCGLCGKASIEAVHQHFPPVDDEVSIARAMLPYMLQALERAQTGFARTGGAHAAALFDSTGALVAAREDVGRHNAVDKVVGNAVLRHRLPLSGHVLVVSSRASFEILQKALGARIPIVAAVSAPSSLAVEFAEASGQTLIGFLRPGRCNVYSHAERLTG